MNTFFSYSCVSKLFTLLMCGALCSCGNNQSALREFPFSREFPCPEKIIVSRYDANTVRFCGGLNEASASKAIRLLSEGATNKLIIDSMGGDIRASIKLGRYLNENDITLYANLLCLSACSQYILPGAQRIITRPDSVIGMHDTQKSTNTLVGTEYVRPEMRELASMEIDYYTEIGVDLRFLDIPIAELQPDCIANRSEYLDSGVLTVRMRHEYFMPDQALAALYLPGDLLTAWPTEEAVQNIITSKFNRDYRILYGTDNHVPLGALPNCSE